MAQEYSLGTGFATISSYDEIIYKNYQAYGRMYFEDYYIQTYNDISSSSQYYYEPELSINLSFLHDIEVSDRFSIRSGLIVNSLKFNSIREFMDYNSVEISRDTIIGEYTSPFGNTNSCDVYTNSFTDVPQAVPGTKYSISYLSVPLLLAYKPKPSVKCSAGINLKAPFGSSTRRQYLTIHSEMIDDLNQCTYELQIDHQRNISGLSMLQADLAAIISFNVFHNFNIDLSFSQALQNVFYYPEESSTQSPFSEQQNFKPFQMGIGLSYVWNKRKKESLDNSID